MALIQESQLKEFPKFLEKLMGKDETYKMVSLLDRFEKEGDSQLKTFSTWEMIFMLVRNIVMRIKLEL